MATQLETLGALERRINLSVQTDEIGHQVEQKLRNLSRTVRMPGFRPGKVPLRMVQQSYGAQVYAEVMGDAVTKAFNEALEEHKLRLAGEPRIEPLQNQETDRAGFSATFEVYPEIALGEPTGLSVERLQCTVDEADVDRTVEILRKQRAQFDPVERAASDGDRVTIDFTGRLDGVAFEGGSATDFPFVLGEGRMLPDFESGVRGAGPGQTRAFKVSFPADYSAPNLAGKTADFEVTVKKIEATRLPEVNAEFAQSLGITDGDLQRMRSDIRANLEREVAQRVRARVKSTVMEALPGLADVPVPQSLVQSESQALLERARSDMQSRGMDVKNMPMAAEHFTDPAARRVRLGLLVGEIVKRHQLQPKPDQLRRQIEEFAQSYENPAEVVRWYFSDRQRLAEVEALVIEQNVVDWVLSQARVSDRSVSLEELMSSN